MQSWLEHFSRFLVALTVLKDMKFQKGPNQTQNHLHITFRDLNEEYKEESIHQHCMKNEHPHTKTKQTLLITLEPLVSVVDF
jgi:hypothetical protein